MKKYFLFLLSFSFMQANAQNWELTSANRNMVLKANLNSVGELRYSLEFKGKPVIKPSTLGMIFKEPAKNLQQFRLTVADTSSYDQTWNPVWGEYASIRDQHKELKLGLTDR